jgi:hypothetical protein
VLRALQRSLRSAPLVLEVVRGERGEVVDARLRGALELGLNDCALGGNGAIAHAGALSIVHSYGGGAPRAVSISIATQTLTKPPCSAPGRHLLLRLGAVAAR